MKIEMISPADLTPYEDNPRINEDTVAMVMNSIMHFGFRQPIVVDADHIVVVGHTRLKAALRLGMEKVPVHVADLTPEQARAYRIADNQIAETSEWNWALLSQELSGLEEMDPDYDLSVLGFEDYESLMEPGADPILDETIDVHIGQRMSRAGQEEIITVGRFIGSIDKGIIAELEDILFSWEDDRVPTKLICDLLLDYFKEHGWPGNPDPEKEE